MIGVVQADRDDFGWRNGRQRANDFDLDRFLIEGGRTENIAMEAENLAIHRLRVEDLVAFLESANSCHKRDILIKEERMSARAKISEAQLCE